MQEGCRGNGGLLCPHGCGVCDASEGTCLGSHRIFGKGSYDLFIRGPALSSHGQGTPGLAGQAARAPAAGPGSLSKSHCSTFSSSSVKQMQLSPVAARAGCRYLFEARFPGPAGRGAGCGERRQQSSGNWGGVRGRRRRARAQPSSSPGTSSLPSRGRLNSLLAAESGCKLSVRKGRAGGRWRGCRSQGRRSWLFVPLEVCSCCGHSSSDAVLGLNWSLLPVFLSWRRW